MKKLRQIEFNEELIGKEGIVVCLGDSKTPLEVFVSKTRKNLNKDCPILTIDENGTFEAFTSNGLLKMGFTSKYNLTMYQEVEPRIFYVNEYQDYVSLPYLTKEDAYTNIDLDQEIYIRTIKLVEEI